MEVDLFCSLETGSSSPRGGFLLEGRVQDHRSGKYHSKFSVIKLLWSSFRHSWEALYGMGMAFNHSQPIYSLNLLVKTCCWNSLLLPLNMSVIGNSSPQKKMGAQCSKTKLCSNQQKICYNSEQVACRHAKPSVTIIPSVLYQTKSMPSLNQKTIWFRWLSYCHLQCTFKGFLENSWSSWLRIPHISWKSSLVSLIDHLPKTWVNQHNFVSVYTINFNPSQPFSQLVRWFVRLKLCRALKLRKPAQSDGRRKPFRWSFCKGA